MRVYLGGPMRNIKDFNFPAFDQATKQLRGKGYEVFSPAESEISDGFDGHGHSGDLKKFSKNTGFNLREALKKDLTWICQHADIIVVLPGWENSPGTRAEVATATALGLPVIPLDKALIKNPPHKDDYLIIDAQTLAFCNRQAIVDCDAHLDAYCGKRYHEQPLAQDWARVSKACEEAGEAIKAYIDYTGQNPRKGECGTLSDVMDELADTAFASIFAIQHFTKDIDHTADILNKGLKKAVNRIKENSHHIN